MLRQLKVMSSDATPPKPVPDNAESRATGRRPLTPAAERALAEAAARRAALDRKPDEPAEENAKEVRGRGGLDPTRYGDWEVNGIASDF